MMRRAAMVLPLLALIALSLIPFSEAFATVDFWIAAIGGIVIGSLVAALGAWQRWNPLVVAALAALGYILFGGALALRSESIFGVIPTIEVIAALALGLVQVWRQSLTLPPPLDAFEVTSVAPLALALLTSAVTVSLALRLARVAWALIPPAALLLFSIAFGVYSTALPALVGSAFALIALGWVSFAQRADNISGRDSSLDDATTRDRPVIRMAAILSLTALVVSGGIGAAAASLSPIGDQRTVLRDRIVPPLELLEYPSPLANFRKLATAGESSELFSVTGLPEGTRVRLATLDSYDGVVYSVSGDGGDGSGTFTRAGRELGAEVSGQPARVSVTVGALEGIWMPSVGYARTIEFATPERSARDGLYYNEATGTVVTTIGLRPEMSYTIQAVVPPAPSASDLADAQVASIPMPKPRAIPEPLLTVLDEATAGVSSAAEQVRAIEAYFQTNGYFSQGLEGQVASRSGHSSKRLADLVGADQFIGDDEQYAVAMSLMLAQLGIPARVVMGFTTESAAETSTVTGADVSAWVEVPFEGLGWVAFEPTPSEDRVPQELAPEQRQKPRVQVAQPPDAPQEPAELPPAPPVEAASDDEAVTDLEWLWAAVRVGGIVLGLLTLAIGPSILLAVLRVRRRRRRASASRPADRVSGGWFELTDTAFDVGVPLQVGSTRREQAAALDTERPDSGAIALAARADTAVFGPIAPSQEEVDSFWRDVDSATRRLRSATPWHRRARALLFPPSLISAMRRPDRARRRQRSER